MRRAVHDETRGTYQVGEIRELEKRWRKHGDFDVDEYLRGWALRAIYDDNDPLFKIKNPYLSRTERKALRQELTRLGHEYDLF
jgi:hypothetical protein